MSPQRYERTNAVVAFVGLGVVLAVSPLSALLTAAVVITMVGVAVAFVLTSNPVQVVRSHPRPGRGAGHDAARDATER